MRDARPAARLTVLTGPSGVGQSSVVELIRARSPWVWISVTATSRPRRPDEVDGVEHHFTGRAAFERLIATGGMLEWTELGGHLYGTPAAPVQARLRAGRPVLLTLDPQGAREVRTAMPQARLVLLATPGVAPTAATLADPTAVDSTLADPTAVTFDATVVNDRAERAARELVGFIGSSASTPAWPDPSG